MNDSDMTGGAVGSAVGLTVDAIVPRDGDPLRAADAEQAANARTAINGRNRPPRTREVCPQTVSKNGGSNRTLHERGGALGKVGAAPSGLPAADLPSTPACAECAPNRSERYASPGQKAYVRGLAMYDDI